jgi:eukaryotic-like serine/threonine-protein kinase
MIAPGTILLDKYRVERMIGQGGMASVVAATHLHLNEPVAIKMLLPEMAQNPVVVQRFVREARAAVRLKGEHVTRVLDVGTLPWGAPYMVMELLAGVDLAQLLKERGRLSPAESVDCVLQVCEALAEAHAAGIVHRDIKPSNLFITRRPDGSPLVKVLDFGISKVGFEEQVTNLTMDGIVGTPSYMSPEQLRGSHDVDARTDIWSLGIVLFRLLSGARPFKAETISALAIQAATEPTPPLMPSYPGLDAIVYRCLEKDAANRFQSVAELAFALAPFAGDARAAATVIERTQNILRWTPPPQGFAGMPSTSPVPLLEPTTLGSSAGSVQPSSQRRGVLGWVLGGGALVGAIVAIGLTVGGRDATEGEGQRPAAGSEAPSALTVEPIEPVETTQIPDEPEPAPEPTRDVAEVEAAVESTEPAEPREPAEPTGVAPAATPKPRPITRPTARPRPEPKVLPKPDPAPQPRPSNPLDTRM